MQTVGTSTVSGGSTDPGSLSRRLNPENEPSFLSDSLLLLRVRVTVWLGIVSRMVVVGRPVRIPRLLYTTLPAYLAALLVPWGPTTELAA